MAGPKPEKKPEPAQPATRLVLPMELQVGDRFVDASGEWEVASRPYTSSDRKTASVRVRKVDQPGRPEVTEIRTWGGRERITVRRA